MDEKICRRAYAPDHVKKKLPGYRLGVVPGGHLKANVCLAAHQCATLDEIRAELRLVAERKQNALHSILSALASGIRAIRTPADLGKFAAAALSTIAFETKTAGKTKRTALALQNLRAVMKEHEDDPAELWGPGGSQTAD